VGLKGGQEPSEGEGSFALLCGRFTSAWPPLTPWHPTRPLATSAIGGRSCRGFGTRGGALAPLGCSRPRVRRPRSCVPPRHLPPGSKSFSQLPPRLTFYQDGPSTQGKAAPAGEIKTAGRISCTFFNTLTRSFSVVVFNRSGASFPAPQ
jgi:hypothetical protein